MSSDISSNFTSIASAITACIAATPPTLTAINNLIINSKIILEKNKKEPINFLLINRIISNDKDYKKAKNNLLIRLILIILFLFFIIANTFLFRFNFQYVTLGSFGVIGSLFGLKINVFVLVNFIIYLIYLIFFIKAYVRMGISSHHARHFLFKEAEVRVELNSEDTIYRCSEILVLLGSYIIEFDLEAGFIEACINKKIVSFSGGFYTIEVVEHNSTFNETAISIKFTSHKTEMNASLRNSYQINKFIYLLSNK